MRRATKAAHREPKLLELLGLSWLLLVVALCVPRAALAQREGRDLAEAQSSDWYLVHGSLTAAFGTLAFGVGRSDPGGPRWTKVGPVDRIALGNDSTLTSGASDVSLLTSMLLPPAALAGSGRTRFGNSLLVYGETLTLTAATTNIVKFAAARPRPHAHERLLSGSELAADDRRSFFSGHAALSFAAATSGGLLLGDGPQHEDLVTFVWGVEFGVATFTATARVVSGRHYPSDVLTGAAVGVALGALVPWAHDLDFENLSVPWTATLLGSLAGVVAATLLPSRSRDAFLAFDARYQPRFAPLPGGGVLSLGGRLR